MGYVVITVLIHLIATREASGDAGQQTGYYDYEVTESDERILSRYHPRSRTLLADLNIDYLHVNTGSVPGEEYYKLVLKVNKAVQQGLLIPVRDSYSNGQKGVNTELYKAVEGFEESRLPTYRDVRYARAFFQKQDYQSSEESGYGHSYRQPSGSDYEGDSTPKLPSKVETRRPSYTSPPAYAPNVVPPGEKYTDEEKEILLERLIKKQEEEKNSRYNDMYNSPNYQSGRFGPLGHSQYDQSSERLTPSGNTQYDQSSGRFGPSGYSQYDQSSEELGPLGYSHDVQSPGRVEPPGYSYVDQTYSRPASPYRSTDGTYGNTGSTMTHGSYGETDDYSDQGQPKPGKLTHSYSDPGYTSTPQHNYHHGGTVPISSNSQVQSQPQGMAVAYGNDPSSPPVLSFSGYASRDPNRPNAFKRGWRNTVNKLGGKINYSE